ncbi:copper fist DNA binding domain-domain-containing protein [Leucosporidium creatinivorum]|uniref:Copper fist DNA binding domain-domain-containing protein n=1 Tax=Leucosporidium creatinivorum TaxID=106004 RepID=A0A1Y2FBJ1_9BASI|nr:copper fist DNA binding domain-domain-containing protein [Leucosporidium creatinivorum]
MVLIDGIKYSCQTCITGHRTTKCTHTDRPLVEIKKKGRPVSQCPDCREMRKTKSIHGRCDCAARKNQGESLALSLAAPSVRAELTRTIPNSQISNPNPRQRNRRPR